MYYRKTKDSSPGKQCSLISSAASFWLSSSFGLPQNRKNNGTRRSKCLPNRKPTVRDIVPTVWISVRASVEFEDFFSILSICDKIFSINLFNKISELTTAKEPKHTAALFFNIDFSLSNCLITAVIMSLWSLLIKCPNLFNKSALEIEWKRIRQ